MDRNTYKLCHTYYVLFVSSSRELSNHYFSLHVCILKIASCFSEAQLTLRQSRVVSTFSNLEIGVQKRCGLTDFTIPEQRMAIGYLFIPTMIRTAFQIVTSNLRGRPECGQDPVGIWHLIWGRRHKCKGGFALTCRLSTANDGLLLQPCLRQDLAQRRFPAILAESGPAEYISQGDPPDPPFLALALYTWPNREEVFAYVNETNL